MLGLAAAYGGVLLHQHWREIPGLAKDAAAGVRVFMKTHVQDPAKYVASKSRPGFTMLLCLQRMCKGGRDSRPRVGSAVAPHPRSRGRGAIASVSVFPAAGFYWMRCLVEPVYRWGHVFYPHHVDVNSLCCYGLVYLLDPW